MDTLPKPPVHKVKIFRTLFGDYGVHCFVCGRLGTYKTLLRAEARKSTHDREQDAGAD